MKYMLVLCCTLLFAACHKNTPPAASAFYYWRQQVELSPSESKALTDLVVKKLYIKFFDVDLDAQNQPVPLATLTSEEVFADSLQIIPTIFITNRTLKTLSQKDIKELSRQVLKKIKTLWPVVSENKLSEVQFDCDWTETSRDTYFHFIRSFREELSQHQLTDCRISATIRLHQIKFAANTGVPPVDRGMLMFYNMADVDNYETQNSILDLSKARQYLDEGSSYTLPLDAALPIFRWGVLFRNGKLIKLINNLEAADLADTSRFSTLDAYRYKVRQSTYLKAYYLYAGDVIRLEWVADDELLAAARLLNDIFYNNPVSVGTSTMTVSLYHLDSNTLKHYQDETLQQVFQTFSD